MVKAFSDFINSVVLDVAGSTPSAHYIFCIQIKNMFRFIYSSLLLIMCMLFTIKVIGILINSYLALDRATSSPSNHNRNLTSN